MSLYLIDAGCAVAAAATVAGAAGLSLELLLSLVLRRLHLAQKYLLDCHCDCHSVFVDYCYLCNDLWALPQLLSDKMGENFVRMYMYFLLIIRMSESALFAFDLYLIWN